MLSVIVPARNNGPMTAMCLDTLRYSVSGLGLAWELILIDDASEPGEGLLQVFRQARAATSAQRVQIVRAQKHQHYSGAFSIGLHFTTGERIFF
jgi:hypothetical protein